MTQDNNEKKMFSDVNETIKESVDYLIILPAPIIDKMKDYLDEAESLYIGH